VAVYPTHGAGSFCNAPSSPDRITTIERERQSNPLALAESEEEFITQALGNLPSYPAYFNYLRAVNQLGAEILRGVPALHPLSPQRVREQMTQGVAIVDTRTPREFAEAHIPNSYGIPVGAPLSTWAGWVVPFRAPIILIADDPAMREDAVRQLIRIGYDDLRGYLDGGIAAWQAEGFPVSRVSVLSTQEFYAARERGDATHVLDVRQDAEWRAGHLPHAIHVEGGRLPYGDMPIAKDEPLVVHCGHSDRSTVAISILERRGFSNVRLLYGGFSAWEKVGYPVTHEE
jgi:rhodanese-related sulfurtransferase